MQCSSVDNAQQPSARIGALDQAERTCIRVLVCRIEDVLEVRVQCENVWAWHVIVVDHDKRELFLEKCKTGNFDVNDYGTILLSGTGNTILTEVSNKLYDLTNRLADDFLLVHLQREIYYVLANPGKKQEIKRATSCQEIKQHGKILYYTTDVKDPPEALSIEILKGQFVDNNYLSSDIILSNDTDSNGWTSLHFKAYNGDLPSSHDVPNIHARDKICGRKPVHIAVREGHIDIVKFFLDNGASVNESDNSGWTLLHYAVWKGNVELVKFLIQNKAEIKARDKCSGKEPIHIAAERGYVEIILILLYNDSLGVHDKDRCGRTPIFYSAIEGHLEAVKCLYINGEEHIAMENGCRPIHAAAEGGHVEVIKFLLDNGASVNDKDKCGRTPLYYSASEGCLEAAKYLVSRGANFNIANKDGTKPIHVAAKKGHVEVIKFLLDNGAVVNDIDEYGTPLHYSASEGYLDATKYLVSAGANVNTANEDGTKPIHVAAGGAHVEVIQFLLDNGAGINDCDECGSPLQHLASKGCLDTAKYLVSRGANINITSENGCKPILVAAAGGHVELIQFFLDNGADVNDYDDYGTPLHHLASEGWLDAAKYLVSRGANVNIVNQYGQKPIHIAAHVDNEEMIGFFLSKGAGIDDKNQDGSTPLHISASCGLLNNVHFLVENGANINAVDNDGKIPLALGKEYSEVVTYLADKMQNICVT